MNRRSLSVLASAALIAGALFGAQPAMAQAKTLRIVRTRT